MLIIQDCEGHSKRTLDYDPRNYSTKAGAAKGLYKALAKICKAEGLNPEIEMFIHSPQECEANGYGRNWRVGWESGPYQWAIPLSMEISGSWGYTEPYYGFDLCFTD